MYSYVLYYNIEKSSFNAVSAYLLLLFELKQTFLRSIRLFEHTDLDINMYLLLRWHCVSLY